LGDITLVFPLPTLVRNSWGLKDAAVRARAMHLLLYLEWYFATGKPVISTGLKRPAISYHPVRPAFLADTDTSFCPVIDSGL